MKQYNLAASPQGSKGRRTERCLVSSQAFECNKVYCPSGHVMMRNIADETILVPISGNLANMERIFTLNDVGACFWRLMDGKRSVLGGNGEDAKGDKAW